MKRSGILLHLALQSLFCTVCAQKSDIFVPEVKTLELKVDGMKSALPVLTLGANEHLQVSFDELTHEYKRYTYKLEHCDFNWNVSTQLFESEFLATTNDETVIEDYAESINTTQFYTHYTFTIPNADMRPLLSGNYRISLFSDESEDTIAQAFFCIVEPRVNIDASVTTNTEIDWNKSHQQVNLHINTTSLSPRNPSEEIKVVVLQNNRFDNAVIAPKASSYSGNTINWEHCKSLIFTAGNEYRKFEMTSTKYPGMGIKFLRPYEDGYFAALTTGEQRINYLYDEDLDGESVIRTEDYQDADTESDYVLTEFCLASPPLLNADVFVAGAWTSYLFNEDTKMTYEEGKGYIARILLKQGYYNYMYLTVPYGKQQGNTMPYEGNFFQTENQYTVLVYYAEQGGRYTRLVGHRTFSFRPN